MTRFELIQKLDSGVSALERRDGRDRHQLIAAHFRALLAEVMRAPIAEADARPAPLKIAEAR